MKYYTLKEAAEYAGVSESTVKRLYTSLKNNPDVPEREHLLPSPDQYEQFKSSGVPFRWQLSKTILDLRFPKDREDKPEKGSQAGVDSITTEGAASDRLMQALDRTITTLENQLTEKDRQLAEKDKQIDADKKLIEKLGGMAQQLQQEVLQLNAGAPVAGSSTARKTQSSDTTIDADMPPSSEKGSVRAPKAPTASQAPKKRSGTQGREKGSDTSQTFFEKHTPSFRRGIIRARKILLDQ